MEVSILLKNDTVITAKGITKIIVRSKVIEKFEELILLDPSTQGGFCPVRFIGSEEIISIRNIADIVSVKVSK